MPTWLSFQADEQTQHELAELTRDGTSRDEAVAAAIHEAYRHACYERTRLEAGELNKDSGYRAELRELREVYGFGEGW